MIPLAARQLDLSILKCGIYAKHRFRLSTLNHQEMLAHTSSTERFSEKIDLKAKTLLILIVGMPSNVGFMQSTDFESSTDASSHLFYREI